MSEYDEAFEYEILPDPIEPDYESIWEAREEARAESVWHNR